MCAHVQVFVIYWGPALLQGKGMEDWKECLKEVEYPDMSKSSPILEEVTKALFYQRTHSCACKDTNVQAHVFTHACAGCSCVHVSTRTNKCACATSHTNIEATPHAHPHTNFAATTHIHLDTRTSHTHTLTRTHPTHAPPHTNVATTPTAHPHTRTPHMCTPTQTLLHHMAVGKAYWFVAV